MAGRRWLAMGQGLAGLAPGLLRSPLREEHDRLGCRYANPTTCELMAAGKRIQVVTPAPWAEALRRQAAAEGRSVSAMALALIVEGLSRRRPIPS